ncbi:MAG: class I SAM-dependent methyltransferase [Fibromonadales bacterium]|nr:class I SAM-dependent methyltransferase [Fibromonadales bacterium]
MRKVNYGSSRLTIVDHNESYGRYILRKIAKMVKIETVVDLGCGKGSDLKIIKEASGCKKLIGVDFDRRNAVELENEGIEVVDFDIEKERFPFENNSIDFIVANQVMEHCKEIYWINSEIFRSLKNGGYLFLGTPNVLSLHNRILGLLGYHPTQHKLLGPHVRLFSKKDTIKFYNYIGYDFLTVEKFYGSNFYPFPKFIARPLATIFPNMAFSIFFLIKKNAEYNGQFLEYLKAVRLQSLFFNGEKT